MIFARIKSKNITIKLTYFFLSNIKFCNQKNVTIFDYTPPPYKGVVKKKHTFFLYI